MPFEYLIRLYTTISGPDQLSPREQAALLAQLQVGLREDGEHDAARKDIVVLLTKLRDREDVTYRTRTDVDVILASIDAEARSQPPNATDTTAVEFPIVGDAAKAASDSAAPATQFTPASSPTVVKGSAEATRPPEAAKPTEAAEPSVAANQLHLSDQSSLDVESREAPDKPTVDPTQPTPRRAETIPAPTSRMRRVGAVLINVIPLLVIWGIAYGIAVGTATRSCSSENFPNTARWTYCGTSTSSLGTAAIGIAAFIALVYGVWNWVHRQRQKGSTIGQSVLKFRVVTAKSGLASGFGVKRFVAAAVPLLVAVMVGAIGAEALALITVHQPRHGISGEAGSNITCYKSGGQYPGQYVGVTYEECQHV